MTRKVSLATMVAVACVVGVFAGARHSLQAQQRSAALRMGTGTGLNGLLVSSLVFMAADSNKDGVVTPTELKTTMEKWFAIADATRSGSITQDQLIPVLNAAMPMASLSAALTGGGHGAAQPQTPDPATVQAMMAALPDEAPAKPARPRKVLVLAKSAGFVHSSVPLAAKTIEALGTKTGAWTTTITYDAAAITADNLRQYDAIFLASTTGAFLDDPGDPAVTAARRQALLDFVRGGKGLAGIHAASDSYHAMGRAAASAPPAAALGSSLLGAFSVGTTLAPVMMRQGDRNGDQKLSLAEVDALADAWFRTLDARRTGKLLQSDFAFFALFIPKPSGAAAPAVALEPDTQTGTWPEFNKMIGGYFKFHWLDPQLITVKIDDAKSPLTAMFNGKEFEVHDETYTMGINSWSRENVHVLTSIDYAKMSDEDKAQEANPRADHDYGLSWIRREGQGRVFYEALGHSERIYAVKPLLEHILAGVQYALGDLKADDTPSKTALADGAEH
jgi:type 1 glutamine amidotransferase